MLIDQTMVNDFRPFKTAMTKLSTQAGTIERANDPPGDPPRAIEWKRRIDTAYEVYLGLYQAITGPEDHQKVLRELSPSFFDLIVIDECHRGSAAEDSAWREILEYFSSATPKETQYVSNIHYFGEPVQIYEPGEDDPITPPDDIPPTDEDPIPPEPGEDETIVDVPPDITLPPDGPGRRKVYVDGVDATIVAERVEYLDENGKLVTESLRDFTKRALRKRFASLDEFLRRWNGTQRKQVIIEELEAEGLDLGVVTETLGKDLDPFDLICHVSFDAKPLTRRERSENVKKRDVFSQYGGTRPAPCSTRCSPNTPTKGCSTWRTPTCCASRLLPNSAPLFS